MDGLEYTVNAKIDARRPHLHADVDHTMSTIVIKRSQPQATSRNIDVVLNPIDRFTSGFSNVVNHFTDGNRSSAGSVAIEFVNTPVAFRANLFLMGLGPACLTDSSSSLFYFWITSINDGFNAVRLSGLSVYDFRVAFIIRPWRLLFERMHSLLKRYDAFKDILLSLVHRIILKVKGCAEVA